MTSEAEQPFNIAIFASGGGSNARSIMEYFSNREDVSVSLVITNKPSAGVIQHACEMNIPSAILTKKMFSDSQTVLPLLKAFDVQFIALAGFLLLIPEYLVDAFDKRMVNIHPALLPKYGGKGMYGMNVHRAVKEAGDSESGMTVHYVTPEYDKGAIIAQHTTSIESMDSAEMIAAKVLELEHEFFPRAIDKAISAIRHHNGN